MPDTAQPLTDLTFDSLQLSRSAMPTAVSGGTGRSSMGRPARRPASAPTWGSTSSIAIRMRSTPTAATA